jgi:UDP-2,3-diacylglucosamine hydrolase
VTALFISDLHLDAGHPEAIARFTSFAQREARDAHELYILGDLFEAWIGDDDDDARLAPIVGALRTLTASGVRCAVMHGNRDFLIGERFCQATGCRLLGDFERVEAYGEPLLLTHGDLLCTDDTRYQTLRRQLREPKWQRDFLAKSLGERRSIAGELRQMSATEIAAKSEYIMDVSQATVERTMREFGVRRLLHGHTHRPGIHDFTIDGRPAQRIVLGAWYEQASFVRWDERGFTLLSR